MPEIYSHSKLSLYEQCPEAYKIKYIDKTFPELPSSIHAFLGSTVHSALEHLYKKLMEGKVLNLDEVIDFFARTWHDKYTLDIRIPLGEKIENFFNRGVKFLVDYYRTNLPFSKDTICLEKKIHFPLSEGIYIVGYIDRIEKKDDGSYEVHDYKTNDKIKSQEEIDADRQLAFYHMGLQNLFGADVQVKLTWHFLAHNKKIHSFRTQAQLNELKSKTLDLIAKIKATREWNACGKPWCDWCTYKAVHGMRNRENKTREVFSLNNNLSTIS